MFPKKPLEALALINPRLQMTKGVEYPHVAMGDVVSGERFVRSRVEQPFKGSGSVFIDGDTLFARITPCLENGKIAQYASVSDKPAFGSTEFIVMRARSGLTDPAFLYYLSRTEAIRKPAELSMAGASGRQRASVEVIRSLELPGPDLATQQKVGAFLSTFDLLVDNNRRRIELLEETARLLYREWFVHFRYPGHEDVPLVNSELGRIPDGWQVMPFSAAVQINPKVKVNKTQTCPFFTMGDLSEQFLSCGPSKDRAGGSGSKFLNGDTLFARITPCLENGKTGLVQTLEPGQVGRGSTEFIVFRGEAISSEMTYLLARDSVLRDHAAKSMVGASGRQRVRNECFDDFHLAVATPGLVKHFSSCIRPSFELVALLERENVLLSKSRDLLLPRLVSGDLDVSDLDLEMVV